MIIRQEQEESATEGLIPPRPNLGPEPWPESSRWPGLGWLGLGLGLILGFLLWTRRRKKAKSPLPDEFRPPTVDLDGSPRQRLIASSEVIRGALIAAFGPGWGSKTTEEIGDDSTLLERLDPAEVDRLVAFLKGADRAKFASSEPDLPDDWEAWASSFVATIAAGASSRSTGK